MKFYPDMTDQILHVAVPIIVFAIFTHGGAFGGAFAGLACGLIRELSEAGGSRISLAEAKAHFQKRDAWIDLAFWTLGGAVAKIALT